MLTVRGRSVRAALLLAVVVAAPACKKHEPGSEAAPSASTSAGAPPAAAPGEPVVVSGTAAGLHAYLTTVDTVKGATFDVSWKPETVRIDRDATIRALQGVSPDGSTFKLAANEPAVSNIKPGSVVLIWGVALRKVTSVTPSGDAVLVHTKVAALGDAIDHGHIAWNGPANFAAGVVVPTYLKPDTLAVSALPDQNPLVRPASYVRLRFQDNGSQNGGSQNGTTQPSADDATPSDSIPTAAMQNTKGDAFGMEYEVAYLYSGSGLDFEMEASKKEGEAGNAAKEGGKEDNKQIIQGLNNQATNAPNVPPPAQGTTPSNVQGNALKQSILANKAWDAAKNDFDRKTQDVPSAVWSLLPALTSDKLWTTASEQLDLRIKAQGHLDGIDFGGDISIANAKQIASKFQLNNVNGLVNFQYVARLGSQQGSWAETLKAMLPVTFNIPIVIGGLPLMFQVGLNLFAIPGLSSHYATAQGQFHFNFAGNGLIQVGAGNVDASGQYQGGAFILDDDNKVTSLGVSSLLVSIEFPRLGFGLGLFNSYSIGFIDFVVTGSAVSSGAVGIMPCQRFQVDAAIGAGVSTQVLGLPSFLNNKLSWRKQPNLWDYEHITYKPPGLNCAYKKGG
jgi:hypothetical protein